MIKNIIIWTKADIVLPGKMTGFAKKENIRIKNRI